MRFKKSSFQFLEFIHLQESRMSDFGPIAGSYAVLLYDDKYMLCYNTMRKQWEIPAGRREPNESSKECAIRELFEETGQRVSELTFKGLLKVKNTYSSTLKYNPVYVGAIEMLLPFMKNEETCSIKLWDVKENIGYIDEVDSKLIKCLSND